MTESAAASIESKLADFSARLDTLTAEREAVAAERDEYRKLYLQTLEICRKLELGLIGQKRERLSGTDAQLTMGLLQMLLGEGRAATPAAPPAPAAETKVAAHTRVKPTGRKPLPEKLPRVDVELLPPEVQRLGLDAFERIGEDVTETVERRQASFVVVRVRKPKFVAKDRARNAETHVLQAEPPELPIDRAIAGPGLMADTIVRRWQDHLPLHRLERIYGREGLELARSTVCGWHGTLAELAKPLVEAMWTDAFTAPYLCTDATGVLVQAREKCRRGHFWVVIAPERHVLFAYTAKHDSAAVDGLLDGYEGYLVADAHAVFDHLYKRGTLVEVACWAHLRRYWFKALTTDPERARQAMAFIGGLFRNERTWATAPPEDRFKARLAESKPIVDGFFEWCDREAEHALDETPTAKAIGYARNQRVALQRFLDDGRLPIHNNGSERALRREAVGRKNWLFVGSDDAAEVNATFVSLLASCQLHELEPWAYLRDLFCLLPSWPRRRVLDLAPANWNETLKNEDTQQRLDANVFRRASLGLLNDHRPIK
ncbi:MAG TPA: IS66 family transposase [Gammaproteobacteria bacterium]|nr:IS66 family transposase [Gammaproteobacteria bacterium]